MACESCFIFGALAILVSTLGACTDSNSSLSADTRITPDVFQYATVNQPPEDRSPGGWRAVCIRIRIDRHTAAEDPARECGLEFGSPIINRQHGFIPLRMAQRISADVANEVGRRVLEKAKGFTETTCKKLRTAMNKGMDDAINGSKVTQCGVTQWSNPVPEVVWPPPD